MRNIDDIHDKVEKRKKQLQSLFTKDEENYDLWAGKEQQFDTHKMAINITGTEMVSLSRRVQASLMRHRLDIHVLPPRPLPNDQAVETASHEERLYYFGLEESDGELLKIGETKLKPRASWQITNLGRTVVMTLVYYDKKKGKVVWHIRPLNPRFVTFEFDSDGLAWYAYETFRSPASIESEYGKKNIKEELEGKGVSVTDYWDREHNVRYLSKDKIHLKTWKHPCKEVPAVIVPVAQGPMAISNEGTDVTQWGQSVFDHVKVMFRNLNMLRSIWAHHTHLLAKSPIEAIRKSGSGERVEEQELNFYPNAIINHTDDVVLQSVDIKDIPPSLPAMTTSLEQAIARATYIDFHPDWAGSSGAALRVAGQDRWDFLGPREEALSDLYTGICRMLKRQIISQKLTIPVKTVIEKAYETFDMKPALLDNDFYVNAEFVRQDAYDEEASMQRAQLLMQNRLAPKAKVLEYEMKVQDVPAWMHEIDMEDIEAAIPEMKLRKMIAYLQDKYNDLMEQDIDDKGLTDDINMLKEQLGMLIRQKQQALSPPTETTRTPSRGGIVPGVPR